MSLENKGRANMKFKLFILMAFMTWVCLLGMPIKKADAACDRCCNCETIHNYIVTEIDLHEKWMVDEFWTKYLEPALSVMTNKINEHLVSETASLGTFFEAQNNIDAQRTLQELQAESASNYFPSEQLCRFASLSQSLAASEANAEATKVHLAQRAMGRELGTQNTTAAKGGSYDMEERKKQFLARYCDPSNNNGHMGEMAECNKTSDKFMNADIDYVRTFDSKPTLNVNFTTAAASTDDEKNVIALSDNLFSSNLFARPDRARLESIQGSDARVPYMDMRALIAKRSVAQNSFNTLIGQKAAGGTGAKTYMHNLLKELGVADDSIDTYLGDSPSYDAQMEVLTKKIYQSPSFYVNLMDNPANVERQYAAMQSFGLMQQRDIFNSILRSEMLLSLIVELEVSQYQDEAQALMEKK